MATHDDELKDLREINNELVQKVQYWKMTAAQRENEKLELMKEINELRLKVIRLKSGGAAEARKLDIALQSASEEAISHLVQASSAVTRTLELAKTYMRDRQELDTASPRWSNISNSTEKVHRVPPMLIGGQSIQPVVSLSRTLNISGQRPLARSPNANRNATVRAVPMHMLQDVYIPLTRIDTRELPTNNDTEEEEDAANDSDEDLPFDNGMDEVSEESQNITEEGYDSSRRLDIITEQSEPEDEVMTPPGERAENPLEGPSWLLDVIGSRARARPARRPNLEPDSTTQGEEATTPPPENDNSLEPAAPGSEPRVYTPTVRRRKRISSCNLSPTLASTQQAPRSRVLQVLVPKMRLERGERGGRGDRDERGERGSGEGTEASPPKRALRFDAPSPNGATDSAVIVSEEQARAKETRPSCELAAHESDSDTNSHGDHSHVNGQSRSHLVNGQDCDRSRLVNGQDCDRSRLVNGQEGDRSRLVNGQEGDRRQSGDSDSSSGEGRVSQGRTRRNRKPVTYKEKPLNRKLRR